MKRPLAVIGFGYLFGAAASLALVQLPSGELCAVLLALLGSVSALSALLWKSCKKKGRRAAVFAFSLSLCLSVCAVLFSFALRDRPMADLSGRKAVVSGRIAVLETTEIRSTLELTVEEISAPVSPTFFTPVRLRLYCYEQQDFQPGDRLTCQIQFYDNDKASLLRLQNQGIDQSGSVKQLLSVQSREESESFFTRLRQQLSNAIGRVLPLEEGELVKEMALGSGELSQDMTDAFRRTGTSHLLAISGLHLSLISQLLYLLLHQLFRRSLNRDADSSAGFLPALITIAFVLFYMALTGWSVGVVRAGVMMILCHSGRLLGRRGDSLNSLGLAALILLLPDPRVALNLGFLLSFSATLGLALLSSPLTVWIYRRLQRFLRRIRVWRLTRLSRRAARYLASSFGVSTAASLLTLPFVLLFFGSFPLISPLSNLLSLPLAPFIVAGGLLCGLFARFPLLLPVAKAAGFVAGTAAKLLIWMTNQLSSLPFSSLPASYTFVGIWIAGTLLFLTVAFGVRRFRPHRRRCVLWCLITLLAGILSYQLTMRNTSQILFLRLGNSCVTVAMEGQSCVVAAPDLTVYQAQNLAGELSSRGVLRCRLFLSLGGNARNENALAAFVRKLPTDRLAMSAPGGQTQPITSRLSNAEILSLAELPAGFSVGDGMEIYLPENDLLFLKLCDQTVAYYTGRGEPQEVQALLNAYGAYSFITAAADKTGLLLPGEPEREMPLGQGQYYNLLFHTEDALFRDGPVYLEKSV